MKPVCPGSYGYVVGGGDRHVCPYCGKEVRVGRWGMFKHRVEATKEGDAG